MKKNGALIKADLSSNTPYIVDIDLDFFTVELVGKSLLKVGLNISYLNGLDEVLTPVFCPTQLEHENMIDEWFSQFCQQLIQCDGSCSIEKLKETNIPSKEVSKFHSKHVGC